MQPTQPLEPLNREDLGLLMQLAGPLYAESKVIERMTSENPVLNSSFDDGSSRIRRGLEHLQRSVQASNPPPQPPPIYVPHVEPVVQYYTPPGTTTAISQPVDNSPQMEFDFNLTEQKETNLLLQKIAKQLTIVISILESGSKDERTKVKTKQ